MGKCLFFNIPSTGHVNPSRVLMRELVARGEEVTSILTHDYQDVVEATGAYFVPYPYIEPLQNLNQLASAGNIPQNAHTLMQIGEQLLPFIFKLMELEQPDYVIHDSLCGWVKMGMQKYDVPTIATFVTFIIPPRTPPPMPISDVVKSVGQTLGELWGYWQTRGRIQSKFEIKPIGLFDALMSTADLNILFTSQAFQPSGNNFGEDYCFVGTLIGERPTIADFPYEFLEKPDLVYISMGTVNNQNLEFYRLCVEAFRDFAGHFVLSVGTQVSVSELGDIPPHFHVVHYAPQLDILDKAIAFITHGGLNSVQESLLAGVPMIVVPQQIEQGIVARQVKKVGAGIVDSKPTIESLVTNLTSITTDRAYQASSEAMGKTLRTSGGVGKAVDEIFSFVR